MHACSERLDTFSEYIFQTKYLSSEMAPSAIPVINESLSYLGCFCGKLFHFLRLLLLYKQCTYHTTVPSSTLSLGSGSLGSRMLHGTELNGTGEVGVNLEGGLAEVSPVGGDRYMYSTGGKLRARANRIAEDCHHWLIWCTYLALHVAAPFGITELRYRLVICTHYFP